MVPQNAIMGHVGIGHEIIPVAHGGDPFLLGRCPVDSGILSDDVVIPYEEPGILSTIAGVLGRRAEGNEGKILFRSPMRVFPSMTTWDPMIVDLPTLT
jgi:hypothetical protein